MIGLQEIASYIPKKRISNLDRMQQFDTNEDFILNKIGITHIAVKEEDEDVSDMCVKAYRNLESKTSLNRESIEVLILVTQSPETNIPHNSAIIHNKLDLPETCACFDISLGCSGFVYGLSVIESMMKTNGFTKGLLFTCDPYSKILDPQDKSTSLLFGDAATVSLISNKPTFTSGKFTFGTIGKESYNLRLEKGNPLSMNGRGIFNFAAKYVPTDINHLLKMNNTDINSIDLYIFHQGSKYIVDTIIKRMNLDASKVIFDAKEYGNLVSSSIPVILEKYHQVQDIKKLVISGFGVGLSWSSTILNRV